MGGVLAETQRRGCWPQAVASSGQHHVWGNGAGRGPEAGVWVTPGLTDARPVTADGSTALSEPHVRGVHGTVAKPPFNVGA